MGVTPLVGLTVFGYMFLIAMCLTVWAALTLRDGSSSQRAGREEDAPARERTGLPPQRLGERPVWRAEERGASGARTGLDREGRSARLSPERAPRASLGEPRTSRDGIETVPLRSGLPEVAPRDPAEGTGSVRPVMDLGRETRREPGRTVTARKLVVSETTNGPTVERERPRQPEPQDQAPPRPSTESAERRVSNDDVRGAKAVVKQRSLDDAFDRFIEVDRKDRGF